MRSGTGQAEEQEEPVSESNEGRISNCPICTCHIIVLFHIYYPPMFVQCIWRTHEATEGAAWLQALCWHNHGKVQTSQLPSVCVLNACLYSVHSILKLELSKCSPARHCQTYYLVSPSIRWCVLKDLRFRSTQTTVNNSVHQKPSLNTSTTFQVINSHVERSPNISTGTSFNNKKNLKNGLEALCLCNAQIHPTNRRWTESCCTFGSLMDSKKKQTPHNLGLCHRKHTLGPLPSCAPSF